MFEIETDLAPCGDQPQAIETLIEGVDQGLTHQVLLGVTGSGKTFTMAHVIATVQRPALIIAPNKTLAAQLYGELKNLFPHNAVEYFVSYYDYYQPEAYIPQTDTYIQKDSHINDQHRQDETRSHQVPPGPGRCDHCGKRLVHLWPRFTRGISRYAPLSRKRHGHVEGRCCEEAGGYPL